MKREKGKGKREKETGKKDQSASPPIRLPAHIRDHYLPPDPDAFRRAEPASGRLIVIAPTRAACETIELAIKLDIETLLEREHGTEIRELAMRSNGFGVVAGTGTGKTLSIRPIAEEIIGASLKVGVVNREREATPETPGWNVVIVTTGIARRWFQDDLISRHDTLVVDEIHQTSAELELCLALGKRVGCRFIWLSATVDPSFYAEYLESSEVLTTTAFEPTLAARVETRMQLTIEFLNDKFIRHVVREKRGVAVFLPTRAEVEELAEGLGSRWGSLNAAFYHGGEPIRVIRPFLDGEVPKPFLLAMTAAGQSALNISGLDTVVIYDARYTNVIARGRNVLTREYLGANEILQMAGRVHGRVPEGEVFILTDRDIHFESLEPGPPEFQLAGDSERVALTSAALGIDLSELELPVALDRVSYRAAVKRLEERGIIESGRLTEYGRDVEAMPVERPWGEMLVHADESLVPCVAVAANVDSLHRMTRERPDLRGLVVPGSDHLTAYNIYAEAVNEFGYLGKVYGLPRHLFRDGLDDWAERRGVLLKAIEGISLGAASVYRTLELPLPTRLPLTDREVLSRFADLTAKIMPFDLVIDEETADGERARVAKGSVCNSWGAVAGTIAYFADKFGKAQAAIEGTNLPLKTIRRYATRQGATVEFWRGRRRAGLVVTETTEYAGFVLDIERVPLVGTFPSEFAAAARDALTRAVISGDTGHPDQASIRQSSARLDEYWRRAAGRLPQVDPGAVRERLREQLASVSSWEEFMNTRLRLDLDEIVPADERRALDSLPGSVALFGDRVRLEYDMEDAVGIVRIRLKEGQARRLRERDLPRMDRPLRFSVLRGRRPAVQANTFDELQAALDSLPKPRRRMKRRRR